MRPRVRPRLFVAGALTVVLGVTAVVVGVLVTPGPPPSRPITDRAAAVSTLASAAPKASPTFVSISPTASTTLAPASPTATRLPSPSPTPPSATAPGRSFAPTALPPPSAPPAPAPPPQTAPSAPPAPTTTSLTVAATAGGGVDTNVFLTAGQVVHMTAGGWAQYGLYGFSPSDLCGGYPVTDPDGHRMLNGKPCTPEPCASSCLDPAAPIGEFLTRIGADPWRPAGSTITFTAAHDGDLWLACNDSYFPDNSGRYAVTVTVTPH